MKNLTFNSAVLICIVWVLVKPLNAGNTADLQNNPSSEQKVRPTRPGNYRANGSGLSFTPNKGQIIDTKGRLRTDILYKGAGADADIYLRQTGISYVYTNMNEVMHLTTELTEELKKTGQNITADEKKKKPEPVQNQRLKIHRVDMDFLNCLPSQASSTLNDDEVEGYTNFYFAHCPQGVTNVKSYSKITQNIYNNIDVTYYGNKEAGLKYDIIVKPHAEPNQIKLKWTGAENMEVDKAGRLFIRTSVNDFYESMPKVYQNINGEIVDVKAHYELKKIIPQTFKSQIRNPKSEISAYEVSFKLASYNPNYALIIDPWATYYGGTGADFSTGIATDNTGNVVITGNTASVDFPVLPGGYSQAFLGGSSFNNAFVVKFNSSGTRLWATYYGGSGGDFSKSIATDNSGNVLITGYTTSTDFPVLAAAGYSQAYGGKGGNYGDAFVVKFNSSGTQLWATYYGGSDDDYGNGIATDNSGNVIITGGTLSTNFPTLAAGGYSQTFGGKGGSTNVYGDAFIVKFNTLGTCLWATYYGGSGGEVGNGIAADNAGNIVITGGTSSTNFPTLAAGGYIQAYGGNPFILSTFVGDAFIIKFDPSGTLLWATYYGGSTGDEGYGIATDNTGSIIITGSTNSVNFPVLNGYQMAYGGGINANDWGDAFLVKFDKSGVRQWGTFYGGSEREFGRGIAVDANNNLYLLMEAEDVATPNLVDPCSYQPVFNGGSAIDPFPNIKGQATPPEDQIIVKFTPSGHKTCATYLGGIGEDDLDQAGGIAVNGSSLYITAYTDGGYPVTTDAFQQVFKGGFSDCYVTSICTNICEGKTLSINFTNSAANGCTNPSAVVFTPVVANSCDTTGYKFHWTFAGGNPASSDSIKPTVSFTTTGTHNVKLVVTTICKKDSFESPTTVSINLPTVTVQNTINTCHGETEGAITIQSTGTALSYSWSNGATTQNQTNLAAGPYTVTITDNKGCTATAMTMINQFPTPSADAGIDQSITRGQTIQLGASGGVSYTWTPAGSLNNANIYNPNANPATTTIYKVTVRDANNCSAIDSVTISVEEPIRCGDVFIPNAFSPNSGGTNALECVMGNCIKTFYFAIYDRWGEKVFESNDQKNCWDGNYNGKPMNTAVFVYYMKATLISTEEIIKKGNISLIR